MKTFRVHMLAFGKPGEIREVDVPTEYVGTSSLHDMIYHYGQNDFQRKPHPSVSSGDVIEHDGKFVLIEFTGFRELSASEWEKYHNMTREERFRQSVIKPIAYLAL